MRAAVSCMPSKLVRGSVMNSKECSKCKVVKSFDEFHKRKDNKDGYRNACKECNSEHNKQYYQDNKEKVLERHKQYFQEHKEERYEYQRNRKANNPAYALRHNVSTAIWKALKRNAGSKAGESVLQYLPYTIEQLEVHIEKQFRLGMTWENHGEWHIDHIYPHSLLPYDSMDHPNFLKAWRLENLQPLWAEENMSKGNKV